MQTRWVTAPPGADQNNPVQVRSLRLQITVQCCRKKCEIVFHSLLQVCSPVNVLPLSPPDHLVIVPLLKPLQLWRCGGDTDALSDYSELRERVHNTYGAFISAITRCPHFWPPSDKTGGISASRQKPLINCEAMQFRCSPNSKLCPSHIWISMTTDHLVLLKVRECEYTFAVSVSTLHSWSKQANTQGVEGWRGGGVEGWRGLRSENALLARIMSPVKPFLYFLQCHGPNESQRSAYTTNSSLKTQRNTKTNQCYSGRTADRSPNTCAHETL